MTKLLLRYLFILTILVALIIGGIYYAYRYSTYVDAKQSANVYTRLPLYILSQKLAKLPITQWKTYIKQIKPNAGLNLSLVSLKNIHLSKKYISQIKSGNFTFIYQTNVSSFKANATYQRIPQTDIVIRLAYQMSSLEQAQFYSSWAIQSLLSTLAASSQKQWPNIIQKLSSVLGIKFKLIYRKKINLPYYQLLYLKRNGFIYTGSSQQNGYIAIPNSNWYLKIGPIYKSFFNRDAFYFMFIIATLILLTTIPIGVITFGINLDRLKKLASSFSQGDFSFTMSLKKTSVLYDLFSNLHLMGNRINKLLQSHQDLINTVSHELRTPLSRIRFISEEITQTTKNPALLNNIESLNAEINELNELVSELLSYAKLDQLPEKFKSKFINLTKLLNKLVNKHKRFFNCEIELKFNNRNILILGSPKHIQRVLQNLLNNALRHARNKIIISIEKINDNIFIIFDDDGLGVPKKQREIIFNPFSYIDNQPHGHGLGLAIVKKIIEWHGGTILVSDNFMGGARFIIKFEKDNNKLARAGNHC
jgi:signal transduction histidine kinase